MTQRLTGLSHEEATGTAKMVFEASDRFLGRTSNLVRILGKHSPYLGRWFLGFVSAVRQPGLGATTDARLRGLANIKTSMANACEYCTAHTSIFGQGLGISEAELEAMMDRVRRDSDQLIAQARESADRRRIRSKEELEAETQALQLRIAKERDRMIAEIYREAKRETEALNGLDEGQVDALARLVVSRLIGFGDAEKES